MDERSRVLMATCLGAVAGGVWGWLYMTENGRRVRDQIEPKLDDLIERTDPRARHGREGAQRRRTKGWRSLNDVTGGGHGRWSA